jgi:hypothetical protein
MRRLAHGLIVAGLLTALTGETLVILDRETAVDQELASSPRDPLRLGPFPLSIWSAVGAGTAISASGVVILMLRPLSRRRRRRLISSKLHH